MIEGPVPCCWCPGCQWFVDLQASSLVNQSEYGSGNRLYPAEFVYVPHSLAKGGDYECPFTDLPPRREDFNPDWWYRYMRNEEDPDAYTLYLFWRKPTH